jgi:hypothetical protein
MRRLHLAVFLTLALITALFVPVAIRAQGQKAAQTRCANVLRRIALGMLQYGDDKRFFPKVSKIRELDGGIETSDTPRRLRALVWYGYLDDPQAFVCPSSDDSSPRVESKDVRENMRRWFWGGTESEADPRHSPFVDRQQDPRLSETREVSYGLTRKGYNSRSIRSLKVLAADRAVRDGVSRGALAGNHDDGWNVALADGAVSFKKYTKETAERLISTDGWAGPSGVGDCLAIKDQRDDSAFKPLSQEAPPQPKWQGWYRSEDTYLKLEEAGFDRRSRTWSFRGEFQREGEKRRVFGRSGDSKRVKGQEATRAGAAFVALRRGENLEVTVGSSTESFKPSDPPPPPLSRETKRFTAMGLLIALKTGNLEAAGAFLTPKALDRIRKAGGLKALRGKMETIPDRDLRRQMEEWTKLVLRGADGVARVNLSGIPTDRPGGGTIAGNEVSAIGALRTITISQTLFREGDKDGDGELDYAANLAELEKAGLIDRVLGSGRKRGYTFETCRGSKAPEFTWMAVASPMTPGKSGNRHFAVNQKGVTFQSETPFKLDREGCKITGGRPIGR